MESIKPGFEAAIRLKLSSGEFECSGSESFVQEQIAAFMKVAQKQAAGISEIARDVAKDPLSGPQNESFSVSTIAAKLKVSSGPELIIASLLTLTLRGTPTVTRKEMAETMKSATSYYRGTYFNNLSQYIKVLVMSGKLLEHNGGKFALPALTLSELNARISEA